LKNILGVVAMEKDGQTHTSPFDAIRLMDEETGEHWSARELSKTLGYTEWRNFSSTVIKRAMKACEENGQAISDHFVRSYKMVTLGSGSQRKTEDILLSRYAAYLTVMNGDPRMPVVAIGQQYFAEQTRRQELADEDVLADLTENQKRLVVRDQLSLHNMQLAETASQAGVITSRDFAIFQDHGYKGLYGGLGAKDIYVRKGLKKSQKILDHMNSGELAANLFRSTQAEERIRNKAIQSKDGANQEHRKTGEEIRELISRGGGTMPEDQPTPAKSVLQLQREELKRLERGQQPSLFEDLGNPEQ
jgi:DNA-damage-inducible protein D